MKKERQTQIDPNFHEKIITELRQKQFENVVIPSFEILDRSNAKDKIINAYQKIVGPDQPTTTDKTPFDFDECRTDSHAEYSVGTLSLNPDRKDDRIIINLYHPVNPDGYLTGNPICILSNIGDVSFKKIALDLNTDKKISTWIDQTLEELITTFNSPIVS